VGGLGLGFTQLVLALRDTVVGLGSALALVWRTAALPLTVGLSLLLVVGLVAFKRVVFNGLAEAKVVV
jgi:hypothetical protein